MQSTSNSQSDDSDKPLVVDLDNTLIKTDMLYETASAYLVKHPFRLLTLCYQLAKGRPYLKAFLAENTAIDVGVLPYNNELIDWLKQQKAMQRRLILATASHQILADAIADHLGLFDQVFATHADINLKGDKKCECLVSEFGDKGFDYVGDSKADLPIWQAADHAYVVSQSASSVAYISQQVTVTEVFSSQRPSVRSSGIKALRPHQWIKNILIFVPLFSAHEYANNSSIWLSLLAFLVMGLAASSVYLLNDLVDINDDRHHVRKRYRPFAAGHVSLLIGWLVWPILALSSIGLATLFLPTFFLLWLLIYDALTLLYSFYLKRKPMLDVITLAGLYTLRIMAGAAAIGVSVSFWLLAFSMFLFLSLAFIKRFSELNVAIEDPLAPSHMRGRGYKSSDLEVIATMGTSAGYLSVLVLALYIHDSHASEFYLAPEVIWLACPIFLFWISRAWLKAHRGEMHDDPVVFALKDRVSWMIGVSIMIIFILATLGF